jgi:putative tricarboxylic transport membrane protein
MITKRLTELIILSGFLVLAVLLYRSTASYSPMVQGSTAMYVRFLGVTLGLLCALEMLLWFRKRGQAEVKKLMIAKDPRRFWGLFILLLLYAVAVSTLGFYPTSALFLPLGMLLLGARKPMIIGLTSAGVLLFIYLVFAKLLEVPLPEGTLF